MTSASKPQSQHAAAREWWIRQVDDIDPATFEGNGFIRWVVHGPGVWTERADLSKFTHVREVRPGEITIPEDLALHLISFLEGINGRVKENAMDQQIEGLIRRLTGLLPEGTHDER